MPGSEAQPIHLHTLESLVAELVSGRAVLTSQGEEFALVDERARSALEWYRKKPPTSWSANVSSDHGEQIVTAILQPPPVLPMMPARPANANAQRLRLKKLVAHRFAGLHKFCTPDDAPPDYVHEFSRPITLFEGRNGSGKTSLLNAVIWCLTGQLLRPQREPENASDFECLVQHEDETDETSITAHKLSAVTPLPSTKQYRPNQAWIPTDTWVEVTFADEGGNQLPPIRRSQSRSAQGKLVETKPNLDVLNIDPIAVTIGTTMPALLPLIKLGSESELGMAISQLTGLSALVDLADHARRTRGKIDKEFIKTKTTDREATDRNFRTTKDDLDRINTANPGLFPPDEIPEPEKIADTDRQLDDIIKHFEDKRADAYTSARAILGRSFDPANATSLSDLEKNISRAIERASEPQALVSAARLASLRELKSAQLEAADYAIRDILAEAAILDALSKNPTEAARVRLYARVADWIASHPDDGRKDEVCVVCGSSLEFAIDPITGRRVSTHLHEATQDAILLSQTINRWAESALGDLLRGLPEALRAETSRDLPAHPCDLLKHAILDELFEFDPLRGVLGGLRAALEIKFESVVQSRRELQEPRGINLPKGCESLGRSLMRLDCAIRFARWRQSNDLMAREIALKVLGRIPREGEQPDAETLIGKLLGLQQMVDATQPISESLTYCRRLKEYAQRRRDQAKRLEEYRVASNALQKLSELGRLADDQIEKLRASLQGRATYWRSRIYLGPYKGTAHDLVGSEVSRNGELALFVSADGVSAPAQHVTNASALRASLIAFF